MIQFASRQHIVSLLGVTSAPVERMLKRMGLQVERLGKPQRIGQVMSLVFQIPVNAYKLDVAGATLAKMPQIVLYRAA